MAEELLTSYYIYGAENKCQAQQYMLSFCALKWLSHLCRNFQATHAPIGPQRKTGSQLSLWHVHSARSDSAQLSRWNSENVQKLATDETGRRWVESDHKSVDSSQGAMNILTIRLNSTGQLSGVGLGVMNRDLEAVQLALQETVRQFWKLPENRGCTRLGEAAKLHRQCWVLGTTSWTPQLSCYLIAEENMEENRGSSRGQLRQQVLCLRICLSRRECHGHTSTNIRFWEWTTLSPWVWYQLDLLVDPGNQRAYCYDVILWHFLRYTRL